MSIEPDRTYELPNHAALADDSNPTEAADENVPEREEAPRTWTAPESPTRPHINSEAVATPEASSRPQPVAEPEPAARPDRATRPENDDTTAIFGETDLERLRAQWHDLQGDFVDGPRDAVTRADALLAETIDQLTNTYIQHRQALNNEWSHDQGDDTEKLRQALRHYRSMFNKLLTA
ncbi:hypothetical protein ACIP5Y_24605 [Nocardia sp. NPDC088792]|uniref:hypothetical protein n=1 Tax=Nocardia sp. NPDC088792 TaxID=3364332 RepID=UPI003827C5B3